MGVVATVTIAFILVGDINTLAPIVTMPFLLTYACIDYSYFALAQTFDIQTRREERFRIQAQSPLYEARRYGTTNDHDNDLDHLFPDRVRHKNLNQTTTTTPTNTVPSTNHLSQNNSTTNNINNDGNSSNNQQHDHVIFRDGNSSTMANNDNSHDSNEIHGNDDGDDVEPIAPIRPPIHSKTKNWYSSLCNRWASLIGVSFSYKFKKKIINQFDIIFNNRHI